MKSKLYNNIRNFSWKKFFKILSGVLAGYAVVLFLIILALRWVNPPFTAFTLQEDWEEVEAEPYNLRDYWVPIDSIPDHLQLATISSEDQRFEEHWGLDIDAIKKAWKANAEGGQIRGGSTITQQVAKNLFLTPARTYFRKAIEAGIAVTIEMLWTKERILEVYLNTAEYGPAMYGVGKASTELLNKETEHITPYEAARMASILPSPKRLSVEPASPFVQERTRWILLQMTHLSGRSYLPKPEPIPDNTLTLETQIAADTTYIQEDLPQIGRAQIPDTLMSISETDPLLDTFWTDSVEAWQIEIN